MFLLSQTWTLLKSAVNCFIEDEALTRGAAIAFYTATSLAPVLLIVIAIAGLVYGQEAAQGAITSELGDLMGRQTAELLQTAVASKSKSSGILAAAVGIVTLVVTASGVFGEMQAALNQVWKAQPKGTTVGRLFRARAKSLGLVAALGFLLVVSLAVSAALTAFENQINAAVPFGGVVLSVLNVLISLALISFLFAAVFKVLPDCDLEWRDVAVGAITTALLFIAGKSLIGWYIGSSAVASTYGAAGGLIALLLWVYYTSQILKALPKMAKGAHSDELRAVFQEHLKETEGQVSRLEKVFELLDITPKGKKCEAIEGILGEGAEIMKEFKGAPALDAGLVSAAQAVEHYEIARYGTLKRWAEQLGFNEAMRLLDATLSEEKNTDEALTELADTKINEQAEAAA